MEPGDGAWCTASVAGFRLPDPERRLTAVTLLSSVRPGTPMSYEPGTGWTTRLPRPAVGRIEYRFDLTHPDGRTETVCDPGNPLRAPGGHGDSSVLTCPGYREPEWLTMPAAPGRWRDLPLPLSAAGGEVTARVWSPAARTGNVLVAHDGADYDAYGALGRYTAALTGAGRLPPYHLVLLPVADRFEWYSASPAYARALTGEALPALAEALGADRPVVGAGASLGALAMLHAQRRRPELFAGLFLQSGSFFQPRHDAHESGFRRWPRIVRFVTRVLRDPGPAVPAVLTCGVAEENLRNNRDMASALGSELAEVPDAHTWTGWRDALDPHLTGLLRKVF